MNSHSGKRLSVAASIGILNFFKLASRRGLLIKDGRHLEQLSTVDTIVFDKTGTLTQEQPSVGRIYTSDGYAENEILRYAAAAEDKQTHPIACAIVHEATTRGLELPILTEADYQVGYGLSVTVDGKLVRVGSSRFIDIEGLAIPSTLRQSQAQCHSQGHSLIFVAIDREVAGAIELHPTLRPEVKAVLQGLRQRHMKTMYIISGDHETPTKRLAEELGIDHYFAETLPTHKAALIKKLQQEGKSVCFVGDGINDAMALKEARVSISLRGASTVAIDTADVILMDQSLSQLSYLFDLAQAYDTHMKGLTRVVLIPSVINLVGALFFHLGLLPSVMIVVLGMAASMTKAMWPLLQYRGENVETMAAQ